MQNISEPIVGAILKIVTVFIGLFGSIIIGIIAYFLGRLIRRQEVTNDQSIKIQQETKEDLIRLEKDVEFIKEKIEQGSSLRPRKGLPFRKS